jgi:hypothetical protein
MLLRLILVKRLEAVWKLFGFAHLIERGRESYRQGETLFQD